MPVLALRSSCISFQQCIIFFAFVRGLSGCNVQCQRFSTAKFSEFPVVCCRWFPQSKRISILYRKTLYLTLVNGANVYLVVCLLVRTAIMYSYIGNFGTSQSKSVIGFSLSFQFLRCWLTSQCFLCCSSPSFARRATSLPHFTSIFNSSKAPQLIKNPTNLPNRAEENPPPLKPLPIRFLIILPRTLLFRQSHFLRSRLIFFITAIGLHHLNTFRQLRIIRVINPAPLTSQNVILNQF